MVKVLVKKGDAAKLLGAQPAQVTRWVKRGMPLTSEEAIRAWYAANVVPRRKPAEMAATDTNWDQDDDGTAAPRNWRERRDKALALTEELNLAERRGELVDRKVVMATWATLISAFRTRMLAIPSKVAPQVAVPGKAQQAQDMIAAAVHEALAEVSGDGLPSPR